MRTFFDLPNTNSVCLFFKKWHFYKKGPLLFTTTPKTLFFWAFLKCLFSSFFMFSLVFLRHKKDKNKKCTFFFRKPFSWQPDKLPQKISHPYTLFVSFKIPQNTIQLGKTSKKNLGPSFDATLDQVLTQKKRKSWTKFWLYYIYIYISIPLSHSLSISGEVACKFHHRLIPPNWKDKRS